MPGLALPPPTVELHEGAGEMAQMREAAEGATESEREWRGTAGEATPPTRVGVLQGRTPPHVRGDGQRVRTADEGREGGVRSGRGAQRKLFIKETDGTGKEGGIGGDRKLEREVSDGGNESRGMGEEAAAAEERDESQGESDRRKTHSITSFTHDVSTIFKNCSRELPPCPGRPLHCHLRPRGPSPCPNLAMVRG